MRNRSNVSTNKMSGKESQTEEVPAQKATSMDKNKAKPNKDPGGVAAGKKLTEHNRGMRKEKKYERRFKTIQRNATRTRTETSTIIIVSVTHSNSLSSKCRSLSGWTVL